MNINTNITDLLKLPTKIFVALSIASGLLLFLPNEIIVKMYMVQFRDNYGFTLGILFIVSVSISLVSLCIVIYKYFSSKYYKTQFRKNAPKRLNQLSDYQKEILYHLYSQYNHTAQLPLHDGAVRILESYHMITRIPGEYLVEDLNNALIPYTLQPWVTQELNKRERL